MAVLGSTLLSGLLLCLGMLFISASSADDPDSCMFFTAVLPTTAPGIKASSDVYESYKLYTISVPVSNRTVSVVLRAVDTNNNSVGFWHNADQLCNSSVMYHMKDTHEGLFKTKWESPYSMNITTVEIQAFAVSFHKVATFSYLKLKKQAMTTASPSMTSTTRPTTTRPTTTQSLTTTRILTTARILNTASTLTTTKSLANRIFFSPITDAIQILLVFLTSKLLF